MALDPRFITTSDLEEYFVDSLTGLPLSAGVVTFNSDINHNVRKPVYQLTLDGTNYTYSPLPNPCILSSVGTFQDGAGNNIIPYYYPYTGTPDQNTGKQELYYIEVKSSDNRPMFTRSAWPSNAIAQIDTLFVDNKNFVPNGQFLAHNNGKAAETRTGIPNYSSIGTVDVTYIAPGGWTFRRTTGGTSTFDNTFSSYNPQPQLNDYPVYAFNFKCSSFNNSDQIRDLVLQFPDANKFCNGEPIGSQAYTLYFRSKSNDGNSYPFNVYRIYSYGTGSATQPSEVLIGTFSAGTLAPVTILINGFPANTGTISPAGDDYVAIAIRGPASSWDAQLTDFALLAGNVTNIPFTPVQTNAEMLSQGIAGWMKNPDFGGMDAYLPLVVTPYGLTPDQSVVGTIYGKTQAVANPNYNELYLNGQTLLTTAYSTIGIPYRRLYNFLVANCPALALIYPGTPMWGTGANFATIYKIAGQPTHFNLVINTATAPSSAGAGTSGFTLTVLVAASSYEFEIVTAPTAEQYFTFTGHDATVYNVWYKVDGAGTAPAIAGTMIEVDILSTTTPTDIATATALAVNSYQFALIDARGYFWRGLGGVDPDSATRTLPWLDPLAAPLVGANLGSLQGQALLAHTHVIGMIDGAGTGSHVASAAGGAPTPGNDAATNLAPLTNNTETRPVNLALNWFVRY